MWRWYIITWEEVHHSAGWRKPVGTPLPIFTGTSRQGGSKEESAACIRPAWARSCFPWLVEWRAPLISPNNAFPLDRPATPDFQISLPLLFFFPACTLHFSHALQQNTISPKEPKEEKGGERKRGKRGEGEKTPWQQPLVKKTPRTRVSALIKILFSSPGWNVNVGW